MAKNIILFKPECTFYLALVRLASVQRKWKICITIWIYAMYYILLVHIVYLCSIYLCSSTHVCSSTILVYASISRNFCKCSMYGDGKRQYPNVWVSKESICWTLCDLRRSVIFLLFSILSLSLPLSLRIFARYIFPCIQTRNTYTEVM